MGCARPGHSLGDGALTVGVTRYHNRSIQEIRRDRESSRVSEMLVTNDLILVDVQRGTKLEGEGRKGRAGTRPDLTWQEGEGRGLRGGDKG